MLIFGENGPSSCSEGPLSSTLISTALFVGGTLLWYSIKTYNDNDSDVDKNKNKIQEEEETQEWSSYFRTRLEHRLSFPRYARSKNNSTKSKSGHHFEIINAHVATAHDDDILEEGDDETLEETIRRRSTVASEYSIDFYPKNSNWTHFELCGTVTQTKSSTSTTSKSKTKETTEKGAQRRCEPILQNTPAVTSTSDDRIDRRPVRRGRSILMSLEGDRSISFESPATNPTPLQRSSDDEETTDGEDSQASTDHFVWTDWEYRDSFLLKKQLGMSNSLNHNPVRPSLPVIRSERNFSALPGAAVLEPSTERDLTAPVLDQPSSCRGSAAQDDGGCDGFEGGPLLSGDAESPVLSNMALNNADTAAGLVDRTWEATRSRAALAISSNASLPRSPDLNGGGAIPRSRSVPTTYQGKPVATAAMKGEKSPLPPTLQRMSSDPLPEAQSIPQSMKRSLVTVSEHRANYNARIMSHKLILIRHGQSMGNINEKLYSTTPDNAIPLTKLGWQQARAAGQHLRQIFKGSSDVHFIVSPYVRTVETFHGIASAWSDPEQEFQHLTDPLQRRKAWYGKLVNEGLSWAEDPRIREQDFGNLQDPDKINRAKKERNGFGAFYYRFAHGESAADVFDRISTFLDSLWRSFDGHPSHHFVLVTHGIAIRVLLAQYFRYTIDQFHLLSNPRNCEMVVLTHDGQGRLQMAGRHELEMTPIPTTTATSLNNRVGGEEMSMCFKYRKRLRVLPQEYIHKVKIRIYQNEEDSDEEGQENE